MNPFPPKWADKLLSFFCKDALLEEIQGDLHEYYSRLIDEKGAFKANMFYWFQVLNFIRPYALKRRKNSIFPDMLKYNILIALRNLRRQKFYAFINITGLAIALACCLLISIFVLDELSYDKHFNNHDRIYRASSHIFFNDNDLKFASSPGPFKEALKNDLPEIEKNGRM
ncbi:MAG: ABC transporter permease, partial [Bacteroidetes bacterium]|nr:ABC transporter permease [Bacteroidota bacterium]